MRWLHRRARAPLRFEFQPRPRSPAPGWLLLAIACGFAGDVAWSYVDTATRIQAGLRQLSALPAAPRPQAEHKAYQPKDVEREAAFARGVITRISLPWNDLFRALGAAQVEEVRLLSVEPDAEARTVRINAEARDIPAMLTYVARLEAQGYFRSVGLLQHELKRDGRPGAAPARGAPPPARAPAASDPVSFVAAASWKQK